MRRMARRWAWGGILAALAGVAVTAAATDALVRFVRVKVETANMREGPGTGYPLLWQVVENFPLKVVSRRQNWLKTVDFLGDEAWIYAPLTDGRPAVVVEVDVANVRSGPGTSHPVRFQVEWGSAFRVLDRRGKWLQIEDTDAGRGWIHGALVWGSPN